ncbi:hypothetical protein GOBAR_DD19726 [Gossypium barbadense]|nr:hypothetical protein GOBAR_DD19726 [Gossypium barbadense]
MKSSNMKQATSYFQRKVEKKLFSIDIIKHVDIYKHDPWDLPKVSKLSSGTEKEWYFFCRRGRKYRNSIRPNRVLKKSLVYYKGSAGKGTKTDWMMHEFRLPPPTTTTLSSTNKDNLPEAEVWTLCRIFKRDVSSRKSASDWQNKKNKQNTNTSATSSRACSVESENSLKVENFGVLDDKGIERKLQNDHFLGGNQLFAATTQVLPSYLSFSNPNAADEYFGQEHWDELRPEVDYTIAKSLLYSDW